MSPPSRPLRTPAARSSKVAGAKCFSFPRLSPTFGQSACSRVLRVALAGCKHAITAMKLPRAHATPSVPTKLSVCGQLVSWTARFSGLEVLGVFVCCACSRLGPAFALFAACWCFAPAWSLQCHSRSSLHFLRRTAARRIRCRPLRGSSRGPPPRPSGCLSPRLNSCSAADLCGLAVRVKSPHLPTAGSQNVWAARRCADSSAGACAGPVNGTRSGSTALQTST